MYAGENIHVRITLSS